MTITLTTVATFVGLAFLTSYVSTVVVKPDDVATQDAADYVVQSPLRYEKFYRNFGISLSFGTISIAALGTSVSQTSFWDWDSPMLSVIAATVVALMVANGLVDRSQPIREVDRGKIARNTLVCILVFGYAVLAAASRDATSEPKSSIPAPRFPEIRAKPE